MSEYINNDQHDVKTDSEDFKAGYRQGYIDGMNEMADKVVVKLRELNSRVKKDIDK